MTKNVFSFSLFLFIFVMSVLTCYAYSATIVDVRAGDLLVISAGACANYQVVWGHVPGAWPAVP